MLIQNEFSKLISQGNLDPAENTTMFFIFEEEKETILNIEQRTVRVL